MAAKFVLKRSVDGQFVFRLQAANGETILRSETYAQKAGAQGGIDSVRVNAPLDHRYERKSASHGQWMFNLKSSNGQVIGTSETYTSQAAREGGIQSVKLNAPTAPVDDQT
ncbi:MAG: YegP family protein [Xanthomonadales bacterium]|nr:YegP family protein [Xanthomonadales bacterium]MBK7145634.1 YegP family protein [Xanthomonadales bacterium]